MQFQRHLCLTALILIAGLPGFSQGTAEVKKPEIPGVAHVAVMYNDMEAGRAFMEKLGFEVGYDAHLEGVLTQHVIKVNDHQWIEVHPLLARAGIVGPKREIQPQGYSHICFETTDIKSAQAQWVAAGLKPSPVERGKGDQTQEFGTWSPDGRIVEVQEFVFDSMAKQQLGQHLGEARVSKWLLGVDLPVPDVAAMKKFYEAAGFIGVPDGDAVQMSPPGHPEVRVVLRPKSEAAKPKLLFAVDDADRAAKSLSAAGLTVQRGKKRASVTDMDGNVYVFMETGLHLPI